MSRIPAFRNSVIGEDLKSKIDNINDTNKMWEPVAKIGRSLEDMEEMKEIQKTLNEVQPLEIPRRG